MSLRTPQFQIFSQYPDVVIAFSTKQDGRMKVRYELGNDTETLSNREKFFQKFSISSQNVVSAKLIHMNNVAPVNSKDADKFIEQSDGLITNQRNVYLSLTVSDCLPIFLFDPVHEAVGLLHAGWRGLDTRIISQGLEKMQKEFGSNSGDILVGIGPGIDVCHFAVREDVLQKFTDYSNVVRTEENQTFLNLKQIAKQQLLQSGMQEDHIEISPLCTFCEKDIFFSYRRENGNPQGSMLALIGLST